MSAFILIVALAIVIGILFALPKIRKIFAMMADQDAAGQALEVELIERRGDSNLYITLFAVVLFTAILAGSLYIGLFATAGVAAFWIGRFTKFAALEIALKVLVHRYRAANSAAFTYAFAAV